VSKSGSWVTQFPIPERLKKFPTWNGYVVHFTVLVDSETKLPNFKSTNEHRRTEAFKKNLCHLCGEPMSKKHGEGGPFCFIGGVECVQAHRFIDGGMHVECGEYAAKACPLLASPVFKSEVKVYDEQKDGGITYSHSEVRNTRPAKIALVVSDRYRVERNSADKRYEKGGPWLSDPFSTMQLVSIVGKYSRIDWSIMPEGKPDEKPIAILHPGKPTPSDRSTEVNSRISRMASIARPSRIILRPDQA
jgi:hypothetical protein